MFVAGFFNMIYGIAAIANSHVFVANAHYVIGDLRAWGWVTLIIAVLQLVAAAGILAGNQLARWFAVAVVGLNAIDMMFFIPAYPFWALVIIAVDVVALCRAAGSSPRRGTGGRGMACFQLADAGSTAAPVVDDHCAGGGQGGHGRPEVVAAQQEIHRMRASRGGRDEDPHHRPGGAAAGAITQSGRPGPVSPVIGRHSGGLVAGGPPGGLGPAVRKPHPHETSVRQPRAVSVGT